MLTSALLALLLVAPSAAAPPSQPAPPRPAAPATPTPAADPEIEKLRKQFGDLSKYLGAKQRIGPDERREIEGFHKALDAYRAAHPDSAAAIGMSVQIAVWLEDFGGIERGFAELAKLRPDDGGVVASWAQYLMRRFRYEEALTLLQSRAIDLGAYPKAALVQSECLITLNRFNEAAEILDSLPMSATPVPGITNEVPRLRLIVSTCAPLWDVERQKRAEEDAAEDLPRVEFMTDRGRIVVELFENEAPNTVANFISLVEKGAYDGTRFHRVMPGFMAQGGDPNSKPGSSASAGSGGPGYRIAGEQAVDGARWHFTGSLAMAHTGDPDTGGSQFYICFAPATHLNGLHTVFGRVVEGFDVFMQTTQNDSLKSAKVIRKREHEYVPVTLEPLPAPPPPDPNAARRPPTELVPTRDPTRR